MIRDKIYLEHILEAIDQAEKYINGLTLEGFLNTPMVQDAIIRKIEVIGEATKNLSPTFRKKHPVIPWKNMAGMRDHLIHKYFGVDLELIWATCKTDLPAVKQDIYEIMKSMG